MFSEALAQKLISKFPSASIPPIADKSVRDPAPTVLLPAHELRAVAQFVRQDPDFLMDMPNHMTAVDYIKENQFELVYYVYSTRLKQGLVFKTRIDRAQAVVDSVTDIWPGFDWQEREVFDLMGIKFTGHHNMTRIMMWEGFPGHPLRKDYVHVTDKYDSGLEVGTPGLDEKGVPVAQSKHDA